MRFQEMLEDLRNHVGNRNGRLVPVVIHGANEGMTRDEIAEAFANTYTGDPPLTDAEVSRAISRGMEFATGEARATDAAVRKAVVRMKEMREGTSPEERGFVRRMIATGRRASALPRKYIIDHSPMKPWVGVRDSLELRMREAPLFVQTVYGGDGGYVFATPNVRYPRERGRMYTADDLCERIAALPPYQNYIRHFSPIEYIHDPGAGWFVVPTHIGTNAYTGSPAKVNGKESFANKKTIKRRNHALIEFDLLPQADQEAFWAGVIATQSLDVLTLVYSGGKSIHGLVRVKEAQGDDLFGEVTPLAAEQKWEREIAALWRLCCSDEDEAFRCDASCKDATRMTRFPGGMRDGYADQIMIYCSKTQSNEGIKWKTTA